MQLCCRAHRIGFRRRASNGDRGRAFAACAVAAALAIAAWSPDAVAQPVGVKPMTAGLIDRRGVPDAEYQPTINTFVVRADWSALQPTAFGPIATNNVIDQAIAAATQPGSLIKNTAQIKIRVLAGSSAPAWAKQLAGGPVEIFDDENSTYVEIGPFWEPVYQQAYADLQTKLAAKYDNLAIISDVTISGCMTIFAEPMIRQVGDPVTRQNLLDGGYTKNGDLACQSAAIQAHNVWVHTRSSLAANPFQFVRPNGGAGVSVDEALRVLDRCRTVLGSRCVLENNSLREAYLSGTGDYQTLYAGMLQRGGAIVFQTATPAKLGNLATVLSWAVQHGVGAIELPQAYPSLLTHAQISSYDAALAANAAAADAGP